MKRDRIVRLDQSALPQPTQVLFFALFLVPHLAQVRLSTRGFHMGHHLLPGGCFILLTNPVFRGCGHRFEMRRCVSEVRCNRVLMGLVGEGRAQDDSFGERGSTPAVEQFGC